MLRVGSSAQQSLVDGKTSASPYEHFGVGLGLGGKFGRMHMVCGHTVFFVNPLSAVNAEISTVTPIHVLNADVGARRRRQSSIH